MNLLVHDPALCGHEVFIPDLLYMDQGALPLTKDIVLKGGDHDEIVFGIGLMSHVGLISSFPASATGHSPLRLPSQ
jgi:hypothetical protein